MLEGRRLKLHLLKGGVSRNLWTYFILFYFIFYLFIFLMNYRPWSHFTLQFDFWVPYFKFIDLFIFIFCCVGSSFLWGLSLVAASGDHSSSRCAGLSPPWPLLLRSTGSRRAGSAVVAHGPSRSAACGIPPDQGSNPCPLHWQADSQPLRHQGSPWTYFKTITVSQRKKDMLKP